MKKATFNFYGIQKMKYLKPALIIASVFLISLIISSLAQYDFLAILIATSISAVSAILIGALSVNENADELREDIKESWAVALAQTQVFFDALVIHDGKKILYVNHGFELIFGWSRKDVVGKFYMDIGLFPGEEWEGIKERIENRIFEPYTATCLRKDGTKMDMIVNAKGTTYKGLSARVISFRDITELVRLKAIVTGYQQREEGYKEIDALRKSILESLNSEPDGNR